MKLDALQISIKSFLAWRKAQSYRTDVKTRAAMLVFHGKSWVVSKDHKQAYFHAVEDFAQPVWDSEEARNATGFYADNFQNSLIRWAVVKIAPANKKQGREALYAPITYGTEFEGVTLHLDCAGSEDDAKRWGEQEAEKLAEQYRQSKGEIMNFTLFTYRADTYGLDDAKLNASLCNIAPEMVSLWDFNWKQG